MTILRSSRVLLCVGAAILFLAGCGGQPAGSNIAPTVVGAGSYSRVAPNTSGQDLLYAVYGLGAFIVSYPQGTLVDTAKVSLPEQPCSDTMGNVYITAGLAAPGTIYEFAHGGTQPIKTLTDTYGVPYGCAVNPITGDLAVANEIGVHGSGTGNLLIYKNAEGNPTVYAAPYDSGYFFCTYDNKGDLFANNSGVRFYKLAPPNRKLRLITVIKNPFMNPGPMQWDGQYVAVTDSGRSAVYRLDIKGTTATVTGKTPLRGWSQVAQSQSAIYQGAFITLTAHAGNKIGIWNYPAGGKRSVTWDFTRDPLQGVTVSVGAK